MKTCTGAWVLAAALLAAAPARAQLAVFDPANFIQNAISAARSLIQINNQLMQLENEAQMLLNQARNLTKLPFNIVGQLQATLAQTTSLIAQAKGIAYQVTQAQVQFTRLYPSAYAGSVTGAAMAADAQMRWLNSLRALETTIKMQAQAAENLSSDENALATLVAQSQSAIGALQAAQATNQLLALQSRQSIQEQQLRITQDRTAALEQARMVAAEAQAREVRRRFVGGVTLYTVQPIDFYGF